MFNFTHRERISDCKRATAVESETARKRADLPIILILDAIIDGRDGYRKWTLRV